MKTSFPGGRFGRGTHGGPRGGQKTHHPAFNPPPQNFSLPTTPLSIVGAARAEFSRGNFRSGIALLEPAVLASAQAKRQEAADHLLTLTLVMAYENHNAIRLDGREGRINQTRQDQIFTIITYAKEVTTILRESEKKKPLSMLITIQLQGKSLSELSAILERLEESVIEVNPVADPIAPPVELKSEAPQPPLPQKLETVLPTSPSKPVTPPSPIPTRIAERPAPPSKPLRTEVPAPKPAPVETPTPKTIAVHPGGFLPAPPAIPAPAVPAKPTLDVKLTQLLTRAEGLRGRATEQIPVLRALLTSAPDLPRGIELLDECARRLIGEARREIDRKSYKGGRTLLLRAMEAGSSDPQIKAEIQTLAGRLQAAGLEIPGFSATTVREPNQPAQSSDHDAELTARYAAVAEKPEDVVTLSELSLALTRRDRLEEAEEILLRAAAIAPLEKTTLIAAITLYGKAGKERERLRATMLLLGTDPRNLFALSQLGFYFLRSGDPSLAWTSFESVLAVNPEQQSALSGIKALQRDGFSRPEKLPDLPSVLAMARGRFESFAAEERGRTVSSSFRSYQTAIDRGEYAEAFRQLHSLRMLDPDNPKINKETSRLFGLLRRQAFASQDMGELSAALEFCRLGLELRPGAEELIELRKNLAAKSATTVAPQPSTPSSTAKREERPDQKAAAAIERHRRKAAKQEAGRLSRLLDYAERLWGEEKYQELRATCLGILKSDPENSRGKELLAQAEKRLAKTEEIAARRDEVIAYLRQGRNFDLLAQQLPSRIFRFVYDKEVFPGGLGEARAAAKENRPEQPRVSNPITPAALPVPLKAAQPTTASLVKEERPATTPLKTRRLRDSNHHKPLPPPLAPAAVESGRAEVVRYLLAGENLQLSAAAILADNSRIYWRIYDKRLFPGGIKEARAAAEAAKNSAG